MNEYEKALADLEKAEKEREDARRRLEEALKERKKDSIAQIRSMMQQFGISLEDLGGSAKSNSPAARKERSDKGKSLPPKYRDPVSGKTWTGRGNPPVWIKNAKASGNLASFEIQ